MAPRAAQTEHSTPEEQSGAGKTAKPRTKKPAPKSRLTRAKNPMPAFVAKELRARGLMQKYKERPDYQQNDYLGWITRAKLDATKAKRLAQMLDELERGDVYMRMRWRPLRVRAS